MNGDMALGMWKRISHQMGKVNAEHTSPPKIVHSTLFDVCIYMQPQKVFHYWMADDSLLDLKTENYL